MSLPAIQGFEGTPTDLCLLGFGSGSAPNPPFPEIAIQGMGSPSTLCVQGFLSATAPPASLTFRQTLWAKMNAIPGLTSIVGTSIYVGALPQTHDLGRDGPAVTYAITSYPRNHCLAGSDGTASARVQVSAWAYLQSQADAIALAVWDALDGPPANPWAAGGVTILSVSHQDETDLPEPPRAGSDQWTYQIANDYLVRHRTSIPTLS